ncbi:MAG: hypothetical protein JWN86_979 [Planctomycetota bacterium]|nr:hypothetical protein [Planctomycetota bacterium]
MAPFIGRDVSAPQLSPRIGDDVVEIGLLLPANRAEALLALSRRRHQTVGQILRGLIDQAITTCDA